MFIRRLLRYLSSFTKSFVRKQDIDINRITFWEAGSLRHGILREHLYIYQVL